MYDNKIIGVGITTYNR
jgi:hypothetical protein